jgi:TonB family protein
MKLAILLFWSVFLLGQTTSPPPAAPKAEPPAGSADQKSHNPDLGLRTGSQRCGALEVISDTRGVDFGPYLRLMLSQVRENWYRLIPDSAKLKKRKVAIEFAITPDGKVADMLLTAGSGDGALDRAAWGGISTSNPFPPLPSDFTGPYLALRFRFCYNLDAKTKSGIAVSISAPGDLQVPAGGSEVVTATVTGTKENAVEWNVAGSGCSGSACGKMADGLYVAPTVLPNPPIITLTAVSKADPTASASVTVHIVQAPPH